MLGIRAVRGLSVTNFRIKPAAKTSIPVIRKILISAVFNFKNIETNKAAPITDIIETRAKTDCKNEKRYSEAMAEKTIPMRVKYRVNLTVESWVILFFARATNIPKANALESIVPIKAAIRDTTRSEPSHWGKAPSTPSINKFDGSIIIPENLKLMPRYAIEPATRVSNTNATIKLFFNVFESLTAKTL